MEKPERVEKGGASMYVDLLRLALADRERELSSDALFARLVGRRLEMLAPALAGSAYDALARELAYDSALIRLCEVLTLETNVASFAHPKAERRRLENALAAIDINLADQARRRQVEP